MTIRSLSPRWSIKETIDDERRSCRIRQFTSTFRQFKPVEAVRGVTFRLKGETVSVVGESGSGKSVSAMSLLRLNDMAGAYAGG